MSINEEIIKEILQKRKRGPKGQKKKRILELKSEILLLKERGLKVPEIVEYLKRVHKVKVDATYLRKLIPEIADKAGAIVKIIGENSEREEVLKCLIEAGKRFNIAEKEMALELLKKVNDEEIAEIWKELGSERLRSINAIYKAKFKQPKQGSWGANRSSNYQF